MHDDPQPDPSRRQLLRTSTLAGGLLATGALAASAAPRRQDDDALDPDAEHLIYPIKVLDGLEDLEGGPATLFIDPIGRPASPTSVAGVHRRTRRRTRRRVTHRW